MSKAEITKTKIITAYTPPDAPAHITAEDDATIYNSILGSDKIFEAGEMLRLEVVSNNEVKIHDGVFEIAGHFARIPFGEYIRLSIKNGTGGIKRNDLVVVRLTKDAVLGDRACIAVLEGTASTTPSDPIVTKENILEGGITREIPLYRIRLDGINIVGVDKLFTTDKSLTEKVDKANIVKTLSEVNKVSDYGKVPDALALKEVYNKAHNAQNTADNAVSKANVAQNSANNAQSSADTANGRYSNRINSMSALAGVNSSGYLADALAVKSLIYDKSSKLANDTTLYFHNVSQVSLPIGNGGVGGTFLVLISIYVAADIGATYAVGNLCNKYGNKIGFGAFGAMAGGQTRLVLAGFISPTSVNENVIVKLGSSLNIDRTTFTDAYATILSMKL